MNTNKLMKRIGAYLLDILVVSIVISTFSNIGFLNPYKKEYNDTYQEYLEMVEEYEDEEITEEEYIEAGRKLGYKLEKYGIYTVSLSVLIYLLYFVIFNYVTKGQTLGKKLMKLKVVSNKDKDNPNIVRYLVRALIIYGLVFKIINIVLVNVCDIDNYLKGYNVIYYVQNFVEMAIIVMLFINRDGRSLHDVVAGTVVIDVNSEIENYDKKEIKEKVIDVQYKELDTKKKIKKER